MISNLFHICDSCCTFSVKGCRAVFIAACILSMFCLWFVLLHQSTFASGHIAIAMWPHKDAIQRHTFGQDVQGLHHHPGNPNGSCLQTTAHQWSIYLFCSQSKALRLLDVNNALWALPSEKKQLYQRMLQHITDKQCLLCVCLWNISHDYQSLSLCTLKEFSWSN